MGRGHVAAVAGGSAVRARVGVDIVYVGRVFDRVVRWIHGCHFDAIKRSDLVIPSTIRSGRAHQRLNHPIFTPGNGCGIEAVAGGGYVLTRGFDTVKRRDEFIPRAERPRCAIE